MAKGPVIPEKLERWPVERLVPYERNARTHSAEQVAQIAASIQEFGFTNPILVASDAGIIAGHGRLEAAKQLGLAEVPVVVLDHLTPAQRRAYVLADNKLALNAGWDDSILSAELEVLQLEEFDLSLLGWSDDELAGLLPEVEHLPPEDADAVPEPPADPVTKPGDVWLLGRHRVMCGDSTDVLAVERLMDGGNADCLITDPPYGIDWQGSNASTLEWENLANDMGDLNLKPILQSYNTVVAFGANCYPEHLPHRGRWICWDKRVNENADRMLGSPFELAWTSKTTGFDKIYRIMHGGVVNDDCHGQRRVHPTQKPIRLMSLVIEDYAERSDVVDLFLGSGTTLIAAEQLGRKCYGMEISPAYCDVIVRRWQQFTGKTATLESTGEPFPDDE